ncbi:D-alanyl-D-alanine carboxypeptidase [Spirosoma fluviale]|uniref:D-alanyl-D-alanine carboxypeptidase / D-alanyl-D-alanine-endopeptidase (Penicillin-binding protein 4) n=1 Tax=Spirosoma fluviale TaxID=1597977 RepID=A0A286GNA4_9BACT|nr:D-alanyl-D-alanine carboxypeptidase [Spirosoma fluviale]SOD96646.1 D-alanyl-D-alanine carboxypeptidase / D-alanyl-D-alanine-endopeptidase (penicillin-binding protein 4) [Spirosoma fluviale]
MRLLFPLLFLLVFIGCSPARRISHELRTSPTYTDHFTGVALYDPVQKRALIQHNADKLFTPASNTKLFSFYAGLLSLRDSLPTLRYIVRNDSLIFWGTGNPLLLHPDLPDTTALAFLRSRPERLFFSPENYTGPRFGPGWAWDDYNDDYSAELAPLPIYGNVVRFSAGKISPARFTDSTFTRLDASNGIRRAEFANQFVRPTNDKSKRQDVPFRWSGELAAQLLADTLHRAVGVVNMPVVANARLLRGSSTDSLYKRMLYVSDNQFAEQVLFMASAEHSTGPLSPLVELRQTADSLHLSPVMAGSIRWVDGSGLSRYNLFTPNVLIGLLGRIYAKVPQQRLFSLLPAAGQSGTLRSLNMQGKPYVFAKSGSMTGVYNLSGYVLTKRSKLLYFSIMHNNFTQAVSEMRRRTAELLKEIHERY